MTKSETLFHSIAASLPETKESKMFGALCIKAPNGKAGVMFWNEDMIFKLENKDMEKALQLKGAKIFTPMENRPMGGWVQLSFEHSKKWKGLAAKAMEYVKDLKKK